MTVRMIVWGVSPDWTEEHVLDMWDVDSFAEGVGVLDSWGWVVGETNADSETATRIEFRPA